MTTPPLDLTAHDLAAIRIIAEGTSRGDTMRIKNTAVLRLLDRLEAAERDLAAVTVSRDGWQTRAEAAEAESKVLRSAVETSNDAWVALTTRAEAAEKAAAAVRELHKAKHGEKPVYASDDWHAEREPIEWVKYTICANCLSTYPCPTITALDGTA